jgi:hypothetical protein
MVFAFSMENQKNSKTIRYPYLTSRNITPWLSVPSHPILGNLGSSPFLSTLYFPRLNKEGGTGRTEKSHQRKYQWKNEILSFIFVNVLPHA